MVNEHVHITYTFEFKRNIRALTPRFTGLGRRAQPKPETAPPDFPASLPSPY